MKKTAPEIIRNILRIRCAAEASDDGKRCMIAPDPALRDKIKKELKRLDKSSKTKLAGTLRSRDKTRVGFNDGLIYPGTMYPLGTPPSVVRVAAANRAPLSGVVRVVVVLVEFTDTNMGNNAQHYDDLFFSTGVLPHGSVNEYFDEVTNGIIDIQGEVVGPYQLPLTMAEYANGDSGTGTAQPNARTMAKEAAEAANPDVNFAIYDNDGDGFVDAFVVIHAGPGAESTGSADHIWSHKWVLAGGEYNADGTKIYAYLTVPDDARIGVCCHELGHLLFGFPDLYDTDYSSEGVGNWCLMGGGSWNANGDIPAHPCAWCKVDQGWVNVTNQTTNATVTVSDVKTGHNVYRLWKDGASSSEYFLVENRQRSQYDAHLPGDGLLIWHIDETISSNADEAHYKVALEQADGAANLENGDNRGDAGDPYPGSSGNVTFDKNTTPNSRSYGGVDTCVSVKNIGPSGPSMSAEFTVRCGKSIIKDFKDSKDSTKDKREKERKEIFKDIFKEKEWKEIFKEKEKKEFKEKGEKERKEFNKEKPEKEIFETGAGVGKSATEGKIPEKLADETPPVPFIGKSLRPDLNLGALYGEDDIDLLQSDVQKQVSDAKRSFDTKAGDR